MDPRRTAALVDEYRRQRIALLEAFPELSDDVDTIADTLEGECDVPTLISSIIRDARHDETNAEALSIMLRDMTERKSRFTARAEKRRSAAMAIMNAIGLRKLEQPDFTASIRAVPPKVEIIEEAQIPNALCKYTRSPDKALIKEALANGPVTGAQLSNGGETLTIRTK